MSTTTTSSNALWTSRLVQTSEPANEPLSVADAKRQLNISESDNAHNDELAEAITAARQQFEHDTQFATYTRTYSLILDQFPCGDRIPLPVQPVTGIGSVTYRDEETASQTFASSNYRLDLRGRALLLEYGSEWPSIVSQCEAVVIAFTAGYTPGNCPKWHKRAMALQVAKWFEDRDMMFFTAPDQYDMAYERIIRRLMRESYP